MRREHENPPSPQLAEALRAGLPGLAKEIYAEIDASVPDYAIADPSPPAIAVVVNEALAVFVARVADPAVPLDRLTELLRALGRKESDGGRSLDSLHTAFRVAFRTSWHRIAEVCTRHRYSGDVLAELAEHHMAYMDELIGPVVQGYLEADPKPQEERAQLRRRLLHRLAEGGGRSGGVAELADRAGWPLPAAATPVAVPPGAVWPRAAVTADVLLDLDGSDPCLLFPGPFDGDRRTTLESALPGIPLSVGLTVPLEQIPDSLRWARRVSALAENGVIGGAPVLLSEDHLLDLWLTADPALLDEIVARSLGGLMNLPAAKGAALTETLRVWLESWSTAADVGRRLHLHPQTVRYRLHQIRERIGDQMDDPEARFRLEAALRALRLRDRGRAASGPGGRLVS
ncbi:PucR-like helix-turn-helix protein [Actinocorallia herbida]|uniref:PucR-like helix-turn-helix protein n=1 Tax=Actinocorallia herbida TaxID=58109 RepID=A0A3N1CX74_9ACTN|nr:PucR family transcriptional regulator [Actinocorallia herbida]ROO85900.1 PucR-like helix-turn-helix protein [Actinocorallia herbida]